MKHGTCEILNLNDIPRSKFFTCFNCFNKIKQCIMQNDIHNFTKLFYSYPSYSICETDN